VTIAYPLSFPATPKPMSLRLDMNNIVGVSSSPFTGAQEVQEHQGKFWVGHVAYDANARSLIEPVLAVLAALHGPLGTFLLGDPAAATPRGAATGTPLVSGANAARSKTLATKGWTTGVTGILKAGDYIQLGSGTATRLFKVLVDADSDDSGNATLDIWPTLREAYADGDAITTSDCQGTFRLVAPRNGWDVSKPSIYTAAFDCIEAI
jgi:hypothetical protein